MHLRSNEHFQIPVSLQYCSKELVLMTLCIQVFRSFVPGKIQNKTYELGHQTFLEIQINKSKCQRLNVTLSFKVIHVWVSCYCKSCNLNIQVSRGLPWVTLCFFNLRRSLGTLRELHHVFGYNHGDQGFNVVL